MMMNASDLIELFDIAVSTNAYAVQGYIIRKSDKRLAKIFCENASLAGLEYAYKNTADNPDLHAIIENAMKVKIDEVWQVG